MITKILDRANALELLFAKLALSLSFNSVSSSALPGSDAALFFTCGFKNMVWPSQKRCPEDF
jgi:hypothetical protein